MNLPKHLLSSLGFVALTMALYVGVVRVSCRVRHGDHELLRHFTRNLQESGSWTHSLRRFREADALAERLRESGGRLDVVFFGSSHGYRGFDPRIFEGEGLQVFNLSSTVQTPLNAYYLQKRYLPPMRPQLVVVEVYYHTLQSDGLESYRDLVVNLSPSSELSEMALATRNLGAMNFALAKQLGWIADVESATQVPVEGERYVEGGYTERDSTRSHESTGGEIAVTLRTEQLDHLVAFSEAVRARGASVVWVTHPLPRDHLRRVPTYPALRDQITATARRADVPYWDYNERLDLHPTEDFSDFNHLNTSGVEQFNRALLDDLREAGLL